MGDILLTSFDLEISAGDLKIGDGDLQNAEHLMRANPGDYVEHPLSGVGLMQSLNGPVSVKALEAKIRSQMRADGFNIEALEIKDGTIQIRGKR